MRRKGSVLQRLYFQVFFKQEASVNILTKLDHSQYLKNIYKGELITKLNKNLMWSFYGLKKKLNLINLIFFLDYILHLCNLEFSLAIFFKVLTILGLKKYIFLEKIKCTTLINKKYFFKK